MMRYRTVRLTEMTSAPVGNLVPGETCFNLNFSNPGGSGPPQSLLLHTPTKQLAAVGQDLMTPRTFTTAMATPRMIPIAIGVNHEASTSNGQQQDENGARIIDSSPLPNGKKTKGRVKIKMEYIGNKLRRYTTFSKRKTCIMKKAYELSTLTGTQVMLLVASETGHVYTFATRKLQPMITSETGKSLIQTCLNTSDEAVVDEDDDAITESVDAVAAGSSDLSSNPPNKKRKTDNMSPCGHSSKSLGPPTMVLTTTENEATSRTASTDGNSSGAVFVDDNYSDASSSDGEDPGESGGNQSMTDTLEQAFRMAAHQQQVQQVQVQQQMQTVNQADLLSSLFPNGLPSFNLIPGLNATTQAGQNGTVMYQMPQGIVYTNNNNNNNNNSLATQANNQSQANNGLVFNMPQTSEDGCQFITIPVPLSLQQLLANNGITSENNAIGAVSSSSS